MVLCLAVTLFAVEPKKPPRVTVSKVDNSTVAGEVTQVTPAGVTIKPSPKAEPIMVAWGDIKRVSNGLTREKVVDEWKTTHAAELCDACHGDGTEKCDTCKGTGVDPAQAKPCDKCKGAGDLGACPKCKDGKLPCPATCIKKSDFRGDKDDAGVPRSRLFKSRDGSSMWFHEGHIGELMVQENGIWQNKGKCPTCGGTTQVVCPTCHGTARKECPACHGAGVIGAACTAGCKAGRVACKTCKGTGLKSPDAPAAAPANP